MVQILPFVGAAALLAQVALGAVVPVRRTNHEQSNNYNNNNYDNNNYNVGSSNQYNNNQYNNNQYQQQQSNNNNYYVGNQDSNQDSNQNGHETTTAYETTTAEALQETTTMMHDTTTVEEQQAQETSTMEHETTTTEETQMAHETSTVMAEETQMAHETTTAMAEETSTVEAQENSSTYSWPQYGSGSNSNSYNMNGYNDCVSQCVAQYGAPPSTMTMDSNQEASQSTGTGAVHTVMVAPTGAGLRYVPFAVNASVGDTIRYVWTTPKNHTVTLSSALAVCNKSGVADERSFVSGVRNAEQGQQVFDVTVETTDPQFYYCSVQQHCQNGMFGIINPGNNIGGANTVGTMMSSMMQSNPQMQAAYQYMKANITDTAALQWGMGMSLDGIPEDQHANVATNVLITQALFGENPGMLEGGQGASNPDGSPIKMLGDLNVLLSANTGTPPTTGLVISSTAPATSTASLTPVNVTSGAVGKSVASVWVAGFVGVVGWLLI